MKGDNEDTPVASARHRAKQNCLAPSPAQPSPEGTLQALLCIDSRHLLSKGALHMLTRIPQARRVQKMVQILVRITVWKRSVGSQLASITHTRAVAQKVDLVRGRVLKTNMLPVDCCRFIFQRVTGLVLRMDTPCGHQWTELLGAHRTSMLLRLVVCISNPCFARRSAVRTSTLKEDVQIAT